MKEQNILLISKGNARDNQAARLYVLWRPQHCIWTERPDCSVGGIWLMQVRKDKWLVEAYVEKKFVSTNVFWTLCWLSYKKFSSLLFHFPKAAMPGAGVTANTSPTGLVLYRKLFILSSGLCSSASLTLNWVPVLATGKHSQVLPLTDAVQQSSIIFNSLNWG